MNKIELRDEIIGRIELLSVDKLKMIENLLNEIDEGLKEIEKNVDFGADIIYGKEV